MICAIQDQNDICINVISMLFATSFGISLKLHVYIVEYVSSDSELRPTCTILCACCEQIKWYSLEVLLAVFTEILIIITGANPSYDEIHVVFCIARKEMHTKKRITLLG